MKKTYIVPSIEVVDFHCEEIIASSIQISDGPGTSSTTIIDDNIGDFTMESRDDDNSLIDINW